jgi:hypothetical protein
VLAQAPSAPAAAKAAANRFTVEDSMGARLRAICSTKR